MKWKQWAHYIDGNERIDISGPEISLPIQPFKGLRVGCHKVREVLVNQGGNDMESGYVDYGRVSPEMANMLLRACGWEAL